MITRINWYGEAGLFLSDDEVEEVAGTLNVLCDRLDCDDEDQAVVDASALCLRLVQGLTGVLPTLRPAEVPPVDEIRWGCSSCGWMWPLNTAPPSGAECEHCGDDDFFTATYKDGVEVFGDEALLEGVVTGPIVEVHRAGINWYAVIVYSVLFCLGAMTGWLVWG